MLGSKKFKALQLTFYLLSASDDLMTQFKINFICCNKSFRSNNVKWPEKEMTGFVNVPGIPSQGRSAELKWSFTTPAKVLCGAQAQGSRNDGEDCSVLEG